MRPDADAVQRAARALVAEHGGTTIARVATAAGCSSDVARKQLRALVASGELVENLGPAIWGGKMLSFLRPGFVPTSPTPRAKPTTLKPARPAATTASAKSPKPPRYTKENAHRVALKLVERYGEISTTGLALALGRDFPISEEVKLQLDGVMRDLVDAGEMKPEHWRGCKAAKEAPDGR